MLQATLVNSPFHDPAVYVKFKYHNEAFLFDLGDIAALPARMILKIGAIFVSHTHMDHFIGFDHLLRICLGRDQQIALFGPAPFLDKVEHKLQSYTWNLVENYTNDFQLTVTEVHPTSRLTRRYRCRQSFRPEGEERSEGDGTLLFQGDFFAVHGVLLDHAIPCLGYRLEENSHINVKKNALDEMGLPTGPWLNGLKERIMRQEPDETPVRIWWKNQEGRREESFLPLGLLKEKVILITPGEKVCYVTDAVWSEENVARIVALASGADLLFLESPFLHEDRDMAARKHHLTARQAGALAAMAGVKRLVIFHFSPKYKGMEEQLQREAQDAFHNKKHLDRQGLIR